MTARFGRRTVLGLAGAGVLGAAGCGGSTAAAPGASTSAVPGGATTPGEESEVGFTNPVYDANFPDPMIIAGLDGDFWAVSTNGNGSNVQTLHSTDLVSWEQGEDALPHVADWSSPGKVWAPEAVRHADGVYLVYYTTRGPDPSLQSIGVARASRPEGPYVDESTEPLVFEDDQGGSIDAHAFTDPDGTHYLFWKNDGNAVGVDTWISAQPLDAAGTALTGKPTKIIKQDLPWEGSLVEGPFVWAHENRFHLFYSANDFGSADYAVGHAVADAVLGPYVKDADPVLVTNDVAAGPGHCALFAHADRVWMVYHAWSPDGIGDEVPGRQMWLSEVSFGADGAVEVVPPTVDYPTRP